MSEEIQNSLSGEQAAPTSAPAPAAKPTRAPEAAVRSQPKSAGAPMSGMERAMGAHADQLHKVTPRPGKVHPLSRK